MFYVKFEGSQVICIFRDNQKITGKRQENQFSKAINDFSYIINRRFLSGHNKHETNRLFEA
jgi:hypothetical protein